MFYVYYSYNSYIRIPMQQHFPVSRPIGKQPVIATFRIQVCHAVDSSPSKVVPPGGTTFGGDHL